MSEMIYYLNGEYLPAAEAKVSIGDLGVVRGYGVFDFLRTYHGRPFHLMDHIRRLQSSADQIGLTLPLEIEEIADVVMETLARNELPEANIRLVATGGTSASFFMPDDTGTLAVMITPVSTYPDSFFSNGTRVITTRLQREFPTVKSLNYIGAIMAMKNAAKVGAVEALYVDAADQISEGTRANFFVVKNNVLITPKTDILWGITRQVVLQLAAGVYPIEERPITLAELAEVDEAFLASSTKEVMPVVQVDELTIGRGQVGPVSRDLLARFHAYAYQTT